VITVQEVVTYDIIRVLIYLNVISVDELSDEAQANYLIVNYYQHLANLNST
jgi:hypothetical protein